MTERLPCDTCPWNTKEVFGGRPGEGANIKPSQTVPEAIYIGDRLVKPDKGEVCVEGQKEAGYRPEVKDIIAQDSRAYGGPNGFHVGPTEVRGRNVCVILTPKPRTYK